jgi:hypothetical protein
MSTDVSVMRSGLGEKDSGSMLSSPLQPLVSHPLLAWVGEKQHMSFISLRSPIQSTHITHSGLSNTGLGICLAGVPIVAHGIKSQDRFSSVGRD